MKSIILCEGKSDAILISYYLGKVKGWQFYGNKDKRKVDIPIRNNDNEESNWYILNDDLLVIWGIGGKDGFEYAIKQVLEINRIADKEEGFNKLIILRDRDNIEDNEDILDELGRYLDRDGLSNNTWVEKNYLDEFDYTIKVNILPIIIPFDKNGALETFLMDAICEFGEEEAYIINKSKEFINGFNLINYLKNQRLKLKGELAVTLGTMFPEKTFTPIDSMLKEIKWEEYRTIQDGFRKLEEI